MAIDTAWYEAVNDLARHTPALHTALAAYALWGGLAALALLLIGGWLWARRQSDPARPVAVAALTGVTAVMALLANQVAVSPAIARPRPCAALPRAEVLLRCSPDFSMPSDHAALAGAVLAGLWLLNRKFGLVATVLGVLLAFSRVYVGVHYPLDVLAGLLGGAAVSPVVVLALRGPVSTLASRLDDTELGWLVHTCEQPARHSTQPDRRGLAPRAT